MSFSTQRQREEKMSGATLHGVGAGGQRFFEQRLELGAKAGLAAGEKAESFDRGAADDVGWIVVKRREETGGAQALCAGESDTCDDESQVSTGAPVVACLFRPDLAEESEQAFGVGSKKARLLFRDTAGGVCGVVAEG